MKPQHIVVILLQMDADPRVLSQQGLVVREAGEILANLGVGIEQAVQRLDPGARSLDLVGWQAFR